MILRILIFVTFICVNNAREIGGSYTYNCEKYGNCPKKTRNSQTSTSAVTGSRANSGSRTNAGSRTSTGTTGGVKEYHYATQYGETKPNPLIRHTVRICKFTS